MKCCFLALPMSKVLDTNKNLETEQNLAKFINAKFTTNGSQIHHKLIS